jgi:hypothetical protein
METLEMLYEEVARVSNNHKEPLQIIFDFGDGKEVVVGVISELVYVPHCSDLQLRDFKMRFYARQFFHQITNGLSEILSCVP